MVRHEQNRSWHIVLILLLGINFAFAKLLLSKGCNVVIADLSLRPEAKEHYDTFNSSPRAVFQKTDVTKWAALEEMFTVGYKEFGQVDILCAGAGLFDPKFSNFWFPPGSAESRDDPHGDSYLTMDVNVTHPIRSTQLALAHWLHPPSGQKASPSNPKRVVVCCSIASYMQGISYPLYFASKAAVGAFVRSLGDLNEKLGIKVAGVCPGGVKSPMLIEDQHKARTIDFEKDELVTTEDVADVLYKLCVDDSIKGGSLIEITEKGTREVQASGDPGPAGGTNISHWEVAIDEVWEQLGKDGWGAVNSST